MVRSPVRPTRLRYATLAYVAALAAVLPACKKDEPLAPECENSRFDMLRPTEGKMLAFVLSPQTIEYQYRDVRRDTTDLSWDTSQTYYGVACLRFQTTDSVRIDSSGVFQFLMSGSNAGTVRRRIGPLDGSLERNDSLVGRFFYGCEGDGGNYRLHADSTISLSWSNGTQVRIFEPTAAHRLRGDTAIWSSAIQSAYNDSLHATWRVTWVRAYCGEGF